ncbi:MAG: MFS transporter [Steroidobacteraceae bacterium]|jgi:AAA family ATP:ADP antiporter|nr:MFS transporter [Steroidobacteraceae bacterium]
MSQAGAALRSLFGAREGEERAVLVAFLYFFLLLSSYYLLRPVRDAMGASAGIGRMPWLFTATFLVMLAITPVFGVLVSRIQKRRLLPVVYAFFALNLIGFSVAFALDPGSAATASAFFVWLSVFNFFVVSVFWSFMADVFRGEEAKRLFGPIAAGGSTGAILGPILTQALVGPIGVAGLVALSTLLLLGTIPCIRVLGRWSVARHGDPPDTAADSANPIGGRALAGIVLLARSPYLLGIASIIVLGSVAGTFMYLELLEFAAARYPDAAGRTGFFARLDLAVNLLSLVLQSLIATRIIRRFGVTGGLVCMPLVALASFAWLVLAPFLMTLAVSQVLRRAGEFGIGKPAREVLFTVVDPEAKYKAKNVIDTVVQRGSDMGASWLHGALNAAGTSLAGFAAAGAALMAALVGVGFALGRGYSRREAAASARASRASA